MNNMFIYFDKNKLFLVEKLWDDRIFLCLLRKIEGRDNIRESILRPGGNFLDEKKFKKNSKF